MSDGPYSAICAEELNLEEQQWKDYSIAIRNGHESFHYVCKRILGCMKNHMLDELLADYMGICEAFDYYKAEIFLRFIGLENYPSYRKGGRMENYLGDRPLCEEAFKALQKIIYNAAHYMEKQEPSRKGSKKNDRYRLCFEVAKKGLSYFV